eukprot:456141_1
MTDEMYIPRKYVSIFDVIECKTTKTWITDPIKITNPLNSDYDYPDPPDKNHPAVKPRVTCDDCMHTNESFNSSYKWLDHLIRFMFTVDKNIKSYSKDYVLKRKLCFLCKQCISMLLTTHHFINQINAYVDKIYHSCKENIDKVMESVNGIGVFMGILSSSLTCPKIAKIIFRNYWKKLWLIFYHLLKIVNENGTILYDPMETREHWYDWQRPAIWGDDEKRRSLQYKLDNMIFISGSLSTHIERMGVFFTRKHWKYFVKCGLFELLCKATYFEYCSAKLENADGVRINYRGQPLEDCLYMRWIHTAYGMNTKCKNIFKNKHITLVQNLVNHPRMASPFVSDDCCFLYITLDNSTLIRNLEQRLCDVGKNYWKEYRKSKECHCSKCNKIQLYQKETSFRKCGHCCLVVYCSRKCQKYDWSKGKHRLQCDILKRIHS